MRRFDSSRGHQGRTPKPRAAARVDAALAVRRAELEALVAAAVDKALAELVDTELDYAALVGEVA